MKKLLTILFLLIASISIAQINDSNKNSCECEKLDLSKECKKYCKEIEIKRNEDRNCLEGEPRGNDKEAESKERGDALKPK